MKLHKNLNEAVVETLAEIFFQKKYADKALENVLQSNKKWGSRDRGYIAETTYEIVRWWRLLCDAAEIQPTEEEDLWKVLAAYMVSQDIEVPAWPEFYRTPVKKIKEQLQQAQSKRAIAQSIPDWLDQLGERELGSTWDKELAALNQAAEVVLRVNTLKTNQADLKAKLDAEGFLTDVLSSDYPDALQLLKRQNVFKSALFKEGLFELQDANSQLVAQFLQPKAGQRVVDACAGAGGKTLHIASLMQNKGKIIALDTEEWKLNNLKQRAKRAGISTIETRPIESQKTIKRLYGTADKLLLDVPCSGLGVLRRNPDAKWKINQEFIDRVRSTQQEIIQKYSAIVKVGGHIVYATCSILPTENRHQVDQFLASEAGKNFTLLNDRSLLASESGYDGFYMALLERKA